MSWKVRTLSHQVHERALNSIQRPVFWEETGCFVEDARLPPRARLKCLSMPSANPTMLSIPGPRPAPRQLRQWRVREEWPFFVLPAPNSSSTQPKVTVSVPHVTSQLPPLAVCFPPQRNGTTTRVLSSLRSLELKFLSTPHPPAHSQRLGLFNFKPVER